MTRYGSQYGPDITFLGVDRCDLDDESTYAGADVVDPRAPPSTGAPRTAPAPGSGRRRSG